MVCGSSTVSLCTHCVITFENMGCAWQENVPMFTVGFGRMRHEKEGSASEHVYAHACLHVYPLKFNDSSSDRSRRSNLTAERIVANLAVIFDLVCPAAFLSITLSRRFRKRGGASLEVGGIFGLTVVLRVFSINYKGAPGNQPTSS